MPASARFAVLGFLMLSVAAQAAQPPRAEVPNPLPKEIVAAWEKAGLLAGWCEEEDIAELRFHYPTTPPEAGWMPVFSVNILRQETREEFVSKFKSLPAPATPFALFVSLGRLSDANLKELARFKTVTVLTLSK